MANKFSLNSQISCWKSNGSNTKFITLWIYLEHYLNSAINCRKFRCRTNDLSCTINCRKSNESNTKFVSLRITGKLSSSNTINYWRYRFLTIARSFKRWRVWSFNRIKYYTMHTDSPLSDGILLYRSRSWFICGSETIKNRIRTS